MKEVTLKSDLSYDEMVAVTQKIIDVINNNEKHIGQIADLVMVLSTVLSSVIGTIAEDNEAQARSIWLNVAMKVNNYLKKTIGAPLDIKVIDDAPLKD